MSISLTKTTKDEVGTLSDSFQQTVDHLRQHIDYINSLAYRDGLTGAKNKTAYKEAEAKLDEQIRLENPVFGLIVLDINGLKKVNDCYGHDVGDMLIVEACRFICSGFPHSPVYRIGGDEFVVILENEDYDNCARLMLQFQKSIEEHNQASKAGRQLSIARGVAIYNRETDLTVAHVFKRADESMYCNKAEMKARK